MTVNPMDKKAANQVATLVRFSWGDSPDARRYCRWPADIEYGGDTFQSLPALDIEYGKQHGGVQDVPATIRMTAMEPITLMRLAFPEVFVEIIEVIPGSDDTAVLMFYGSLAKIIKNVNGNPKVCRLTVAGIKSRLDARLSLVVGQFCPWSFGARPCRKDLVEVTEDGTVSSINGQDITISGLSNTSNPAYWRFGEVKYDRLALSIFAHAQGTSNFKLVRPPPAYWLGKTVTVIPGCDKSLDGPQGCRVWGQEDVYGGMGRRMPDRQPVFQEGDE